MNPIVTALVSSLGDKTAAAKAAIAALGQQGSPLAEIGRTVDPGFGRGGTGSSLDPGFGRGGGGSAYDPGFAGLSPAEAWIIQHESGGRTTAKNPKSTAFGIWQGLQSTRNAYGRKLGIDPNTTDYNQQLAMFRAYVKDRYGTPERAMSFWQQHHWY